MRNFLNRVTQTKKDVRFIGGGVSLRVALIHRGERQQWEYGKLSCTAYSNDSMPNGGRPDTTTVRVISILGTHVSFYLLLLHWLPGTLWSWEEPTACLDYQWLTSYTVVFRVLITFRYWGPNPILQCIKTTRARLVDNMLEIFGRNPVPVSVGLPVVFTASIGGFPPSLQTHSGVVPSNMLRPSSRFLCTHRLR
jgi:hypothetical protein